MVRPTQNLQPGELPPELAWLDLQLLADTTPLEGWEVGGHCYKTVDYATFYPPKNLRGPNTSIEARKVCAGCPVTYECLATALRTHPRMLDYGIWGSTTARQRRTIRDAIHARKLRRSA